MQTSAAQLYKTGNDVNHPNSYNGVTFNYKHLMNELNTGKEEIAKSINYINKLKNITNSQSESFDRDDINKRLMEYQSYKQYWERAIRLLTWLLQHSRAYNNK